MGAFTTLADKDANLLQEVTCSSQLTLFAQELTVEL